MLLRFHNEMNDYHSFAVHKRMRLLLNIVLLTACCAALAAPLSNRLTNHASPYLAMHGEDPVHWREWDGAAFERARKENKLVFVSSGYFSCHWCHVMQRESYRDAAIAAYINRHFIPVKIDRELLPDVDAGLIDFAEHTRGQAGWPLNVFLTPEGYPLAATLYLPPQELQTFLANIQKRWTEDSDTLKKMAVDLEKATSATVSEPPSASIEDLSPQFVAQALDMADELSGGFGAQSKFPMAPQLLALLDIHARQPDPRLASFLRLSLEQMASQGLRDHLGGGFFRYTVDPTWQTPHFEKMLYDNALLIRLYLRAARVLETPAFAAIARETLDFVLGQMAAPAGGYYAALSAVDSAGVEGGYYLWHAADVERLAGVDWPLLRRYWGLETRAAFAAGEHLVPHLTIKQTATALGRPEEEVQARIEQVTQKLLKQRSQRSLPIDTKVLAGWNGLMLTALVEAAYYFEPKQQHGPYTKAARALAEFISSHFVVEDVLLRMRTDLAPSPASLEDYAYVIEGLQAWQAAFGHGGDAQLRTLTDTAWERFYLDMRWHQGGDSLLRWHSGAHAIADGPLPSPAAVLMRVSTDRSAHVLNAARAAYPVVAQQVFQHASYVGLYTKPFHLGSEQ